MTAVVRFAFKNRWPILIGDLLLSGPEQPGKIARIPTANNVIDIFPSGSAIVPYNLQQKVVVISDDLVLGWAGNFLSAKEVIRDIYAQSKSTKFTIDSLSEFFMSLPQTIMDSGVGFVGLVKEQDGIAGFGYQHKSVVTKNFGKVGLLGSGSEEIETFLNQSSDFQVQFDGQPNVLEESVGFALTLTGVLLNRELATLSSLRKFYGGGYEIASLIRGKFRKISEMAYIFWTAQVIDGEVRIGQVPKHVLSFAYIGDILTIHSASFEESKDQVVISQSAYGVLPMYRAVSKQEIESLNAPDLNQKWLCNYFLITPQSGRRLIFAHIEHRLKNHESVNFIEEKNQLRVEVRKEFVLSVGEQIFSHFNM